MPQICAKLNERCLINATTEDDKNFEIRPQHILCLFKTNR